MCHYITAFLPVDANLPLAESVFDRHKLGFHRITNTFVQTQVSANDTYVLTTRKHCDCGTPLGSLARINVGKADSTAEQAEKFRKQGWSASKVQRWLEQKQQTAQSKVQKKENQELPQVSSWQDFLSEVMQSGSTSRLGLLLHWYKSGPETERIDIAGHEKIALPDLTADILLHMREDVVYTFVQARQD